MTKEGKLGLLLSKSQVYRSNFMRAAAKGDTQAAAKWKQGYQAIKLEISELKED